MLRFFSSRKLAGVLAVVVIGLCAAGVMRIFHSWYFYALLTLAGINLLLCSVKTGWNAGRPGTLIIHAGVLTVLAGAAVSGISGTRGHLSLSRGEVKQSFETSAGAKKLPGFGVRLDNFNRHNFRSEISIIENGVRTAGENLAVNHPFKFRGYVFYQAGYNPDRPGWTYLRVVRDPGVGIVYAGFLLLNAGALLTALTALRKREI